MILLEIVKDVARRDCDFWEQTNSNSFLSSNKKSVFLHVHRKIVFYKENVFITAKAVTRQRTKLMAFLCAPKKS